MHVECPPLVNDLSPTCLRLHASHARIVRYPVRRVRYADLKGRMNDPRPRRNAGARPRRNAGAEWPSASEELGASQ